MFLKLQKQETTPTTSLTPLKNGIQSARANPDWIPNQVWDERGGTIIVQENIETHV